MASTLRDAPTYASLTSPEFEAAAAVAVERMLARQTAFDSEWLPDGFRSWSCDQGEGMIRFLNADGTGIEAAVQIVGTYAPDSETWEWGWNNPHVNEELSRDARAARALGETRGFAPLTTGIVRASLEESRRMLAMAVGAVDAPAVHWGKAGPYVIAMTYRNARRIAGTSPRAPEGAAGEGHPRDGDTADGSSSPGLIVALLAWFASAILGLLFGRYYRGPIALKRGAPTPYGMSWKPLIAEREKLVAPYLLEDLTEIERTVVSRGFSTPFRVEVKLTEEATRIATMFERASDGTLGFAFVSASQYTGVSRTTTFETRFVDGIRLYTSNGPNIGATPPRANARPISFPAITDVARLNEIHQFRVRERAATVATIPRTRGADPIAYTDAESREVQDHWMRCGYYRRIANGMLALTWRGAMLSAWRLSFPWKQLNAWRNARQAAAVLRRMDA